MKCNVSKMAVFCGSLAGHVQKMASVNEIRGRVVVYSALTIFAE